MNQTSARQSVLIALVVGAIIVLSPHPAKAGCVGCVGASAFNVICSYVPSSNGSKWVMPAGGPVQLIADPSYSAVECIATGDPSNIYSTTGTFQTAANVLDVTLVGVTKGSFTTGVSVKKGTTTLFGQTLSGAGDQAFNQLIDKSNVAGQIYTVGGATPNGASGIPFPPMYTYLNVRRPSTPTPGSFTLWGTANCKATAPSNDFTWAAASGASYYALYKDGSPITTITGTSASDTGVTGGTAYQYAVWAVNSAGAMTSNAITLTARSNCLPPTVTVSPSSATLAPGATQQFSAKVTGSSLTPGWSVTKATVGAITSAGTFTAGQTVGSYPGVVKAAITYAGGPEGFETTPDGTLPSGWIDISAGGNTSVGVTSTAGNPGSGLEFVDANGTRATPESPGYYAGVRVPFVASSGGTVAFDIKPKQAGQQFGVALAGTEGQFIYVYLGASGDIEYWTGSKSGHYVSLGGSWQANQWIHLAVSWTGAGFDVALGGTKLNSSQLPFSYPEHAGDVSSIDLYTGYTAATSDTGWTGTYDVDNLSYPGSNGSVSGRASVTIANQSTSNMITGDVFAGGNVANITVDKSSVVSATGTIKNVATNNTIANYTRNTVEKTDTLIKNILAEKGHELPVANGQAVISNTFNLNPKDSANPNDPMINAANPEGGVWHVAGNLVIHTTTFKGRGTIVVDGNVQLMPMGSTGTVTYSNDATDLLGVIARAKGATNQIETFESTAAGQLPSGWVNQSGALQQASDGTWTGQNGSGLSVGVATDAGNPTNGLHLVDTDGTAASTTNTHYAGTLTYFPSTNQGSLSLDIRPGQTADPTHQFGLAIGSGSGSADKEFLYVYLSQRNGQQPEIQYWCDTGCSGASGYYDLGGSYTAGQWSNLKVTWDSTAKTFDVYLNATKLNSQPIKYSYPNNAAPATFFQLFTGYECCTDTSPTPAQLHGFTGTYDVDNVSYPGFTSNGDIAIQGMTTVNGAFYSPAGTITIGEGTTVPKGLFVGKSIVLGSHNISVTYDGRITKNPPLGFSQSFTPSVSEVTP